MSVVSVEHLTKRYDDVVAVDDVSFEMSPGGIVAMLGPNGAGKTTIVEALEGFLEPSGGSVRVLGRDPRRGGRTWRARIGLVLQSSGLNTESTVHDLIKIFAGLYPNPRAVADVLDLVGLSDEATVRVGALSGGQQRRVDLALALVGRPEILFLDEPTTGLDPHARRQCWATVETLVAAGTTVLLTTHYLDEADHLADRVLVLSGGRIVADTNPAELRARSGPSTIRYRVPATAPVSDLLAALSPLALPVDFAEGVLLIRASNVAGVLGPLLAWARRNDVALSGLEVGPPSLEDAYLSIVGGVSAAEEDHRVAS